MNSTSNQAPRVRKRYLVAAGVLAIVFLCGFGIASYFKLSPGTETLRKSLVRSATGEWENKIELRVGWFTTGLVRAGSRLLNLAPEPRAAIKSLHSAEVGVYNLRTESACPDRSALLAEADRAMTAGGWERIVGVLANDDLVAVYMPRRGFSSTRMKFCLMALHDHRLVVASASGNLEPLLELATKQMDARLTSQRRSGEDGQWRNQQSRRVPVFGRTIL